MPQIFILVLFWLISGIIRNALRQPPVPPARRGQPPLPPVWNPRPAQPMRRPTLPPGPRTRPIIIPPRSAPETPAPVMLMEEGTSSEHGEPHGELHKLDRLAPKEPMPTNEALPALEGFSEKSVLNGIVWAEIMSPPRARRPYHPPKLGER